MESESRVERAPGKIVFYSRVRRRASSKHGRSVVRYEIEIPWKVVRQHQDLINELQHTKRIVKVTVEVVG